MQFEDWELWSFRMVEEPESAEVSQWTEGSGSTTFTSALGAVEVSMSSKGVKRTVGNGSPKE